jgi:NADPH:quinone reductase-like Zn-dependent oxidoreductase
VQVTHDPSVPEPQAGEARVRVEASSVLFTDTLVRKGI